jgi:hypothetical protein
MPLPPLAHELGAGIARRWVPAICQARSGDDYAYRLLGLVWTEVKDHQIKAATHDLAAQQHSERRLGRARACLRMPMRPGFHYRPWLLRTQVKFSEHPGYWRGVDYLTPSQETDGSWHVRTRAFGFQPYFESGFPHGHD